MFAWLIIWLSVGYWYCLDCGFSFSRWGYLWQHCPCGRILHRWILSCFEHNDLSNDISIERNKTVVGGMQMLFYSPHCGTVHNFWSVCWLPCSPHSECYSWCWNNLRYSHAFITCTFLNATNAHFYSCSSAHCHQQFNSIPCCMMIETSKKTCASI